MDIGQLFLSLGVKGTEKTVGALTNVKEGLGKVSSMSLEAKAGIIAATYALEQLFATSGKAGTDLTNFSAVTGESVKTLQQYQYAARQVGVSNDEVSGSFKTLQSNMTKTLLNQGGPTGLRQVSLATGGLSRKDIEEFSKSPEKLIQKLQEYAGKEKNVGLRNEVLKSFGLGDGMIAALSRNAFRTDVLKKAPTYNNAEVGQLDKANIAWSNLGNKIQMAVGHFNAMHGGQLVGDISKIVDQVIRLSEAFVKLTEKLHLFEGIGKVFEGWAKIFGAVTNGVDKVTQSLQTPGKTKELLKDSFEGSKNVIMGMAGDLWDKVSGPKGITPPVAKSVAGGNTQTNNVVVNNHFQHAGNDHKKIGDSVKHSVQQAHRQLSAAYQGT